MRRSPPGTNYSRNDVNLLRGKYGLGAFPVDTPQATLNMFYNAYGDFKPLSTTTMFVMCPQDDFIANFPKYKDALDATCAFIKRNGKYITNIYVGMQTHTQNHISDADFWVTVLEDGNIGPQIKPFETVTFADFGKKYVPKECIMSCLTTETGESKFTGMGAIIYDHLSKYLKDRGDIVIMPEMGIVGNKGSAVSECFYETIKEWSDKYYRNATYVNLDSDRMYQQFSFGVGLDNKPAHTNDIENMFNVIKASDYFIVSGGLVEFNLSMGIAHAYDILKHSGYNLANMIYLLDCGTPIGTPTEGPLSEAAKVIAEENVDFMLSKICDAGCAEEDRPKIYDSKFVGFELWDCDNSIHMTYNEKAIAQPVEMSKDPMTRTNRHASKPKGLCRVGDGTCKR